MLYNNIMSILSNFFDLFKFGVDSVNVSASDNIRLNGASVFNYRFMLYLDEKEYPKYLAKAYYIKSGQKLNLRNPRTINEKIQWLKLYDNIPIKTKLTDKLLVRDWVLSEIGEEYLKPVLQVCDGYNDILFDELPNSIVIKCNHGCKWHFIVKNKKELLNNNRLSQFIEQQITGWLEQTFFAWSNFETQYKNIKPKLLIEPYFSNNILQVQVWCFNGQPKIIQKIWIENTDNKKITKVSTFDENYNFIDLNFTKATLEKTDAEEILKETVRLSKKLSEKFKFVRVDWMVTDNKLYFEEMTFTPFSGFIVLSEDQKHWHKELGKMLNLKGE